MFTFYFIVDISEMLGKLSCLFYSYQVTSLPWASRNTHLRTALSDRTFSNDP
jgi:hypothetical protein